MTERPHWWSESVRLRHALLDNFKGVKHLPIDFTAKSHEGTRQLTCLIGDNGSGKTTVLQAIALTLSLATRRTREPSAFNWHGFLAHRVASLGPTRVELDVALDHEEVALTRTLFQDWYDSLPADFRQTRRIVPPSENKEVTLVYESGRVTSPQGFEAVNQFLGRYYIKQLQKTQPQRKELFRSLGDVFWFDQYRNLGTASGARAEDGEAVDGEPESWKAGVEQLREFLVGWWSYHLAPAPAGRRQFLPMLEERFQQVFPDVRFRGIRPRDDVAAPRAADFEFLLESDGKVYDLAEMSSGEQAVFPLLYEFVRLDIARSIVLIDELELHLHPPQQQALLAALPRIGPDCQFIITTHSSFLEEVIPDEHEVRLPGGQRCL